MIQEFRAENACHGEVNVHGGHRGVALPGQVDVLVEQDSLEIGPAIFDGHTERAQR